MLPFAMAAMAFTYTVDGVEYECDSSKKTAVVTYFKADGSTGADIVIPEKIKARINQYVDFTEYTVTSNTCMLITIDINLSKASTPHI